MKRVDIVLLFAVLSFSFSCTAQIVFGAGKYNKMCSYYGETVTGDIKISKAEPVTEAVVKNVMASVGLNSNFELRASTNIPTAAAVLIKSKRYILYNPKFMSEINIATKSDWAAVSILAHEIGHHLNGHTLDNLGSRPKTELEADEFSGFVLRKLGASLTDAQAVMEVIASLKGSHSHPPKHDRLSAIAAGWNRAGEEVQNSNTIADNKPKAVKPVETPKPAPPTTVKSAPKTTVKVAPSVKETPVAKAEAAQPKTRQEKIEESVMSNRNIVSDAYFDATPNGRFYLTSKGNLLEVDKDKVYLVASLAQSNKAGYKMMLTDNQSVYLYITTNGALVNSAGKEVGFLKSRQ